MIKYKDEKIDILDKKRIYLIDKINAYFKTAVDYETNPINSKIWLCERFDRNVDKALEIFK